MVTDIIENKDYRNLIESQVYEVIEFLLSQNHEFSITANIKSVDFNPQVPNAISDSFQHFTLFTLSNYTYESIQLTQDYISFEAGFGSENFGSVVTVPLNGVFQIVLSESILYLNPTATVESFFEDEIIKDNVSQESRSMNAFKMNNSNKSLF